MPTQPPWLITDDFTETDLGTLKAGKESEVFLVERNSATGSCLLVHKRYIPLSVTKGVLHDRGFSRARTFTNDAPYWEDKRMKKSAHREQRAITKRTSYGRTLLFEMWAAQEYAVMERLWRAGAPVPFPVSCDTDVIVMEYVGDRGRAAPQLVHARLEGADLRSAQRQWFAAMSAMVTEGLVHADLSPYNMLWWKGRLIVIDFPQAVDLLGHPQGFEVLHRDVLNVGTWFVRRGIRLDLEALFAELVAIV